MNGVSTTRTGDFLAVRNLACLRGGRILFEALSLEVRPGGALRVRGRNGAGKSSLLRLLAGLLQPLAGDVTRPSAIAYLGHENALKLDSRLQVELGFWAGLDHAPASALAAAIERFDLARLLPLEVRLLSNGQRRRAALARLAASGADLWLLDEPEVGLDRHSVDALAEAIAEHRARGGLVVIASHADLDLPGCDEIALDNLAPAAML